MASRTIKFDTSDLAILLKALELYSNREFSGHSAKVKSLIKKCENNMKTIKVSSRKGKGRNLQKFVCEELSSLLGIPYKQEDDSSEISSRPMGMSGNDIILRGTALQKFPYSVECKNSESFNFIATMEQVTSNTAPNTDWLIVHKRKTFTNPVIIMDWYAFKKLFSTGGKHG